MANEGIEVVVCHYDNPHQVLDTLQGRREPSYLDQLGAVGGGSFIISVSDPKVVEDPTLLDYRNVIRVKVDGQYIGGWLIQGKQATIIGQGEAAEEGFSVSGEGYLTWLSDAEVQPLGGIKKTSPKTRSFSFASPVGAWYKPGDWIAPVTAGYAYRKPEKWPETNTPRWLWGINYSTTVLEGLNYFRHTFNVATEGDYVIYLAADDFMDVYIDGALVVTSDGKTSAAVEATKVEVHLTPGTHIVGIRVANQVGSAGVAEAIFLKGEDDKETLLTSSATTGEWKVQAYPTTAPGWSPGEIMLTLLEEAENRGVRFATWMLPTFTSTSDSNGASWGEPADWTFNIGESLLSVLNKLVEIGIEPWVDPETFAFNMAPFRGEDRSSDPNAIVFEKGKNLRKATSQGVGKIKNTLSVLTADGWLLEDITHSDSSSKYGTLEGTLEANVSTAVAKALVQQVFKQRATPEEGASYDIYPTDEVPFRDFNSGTWVKAPNDRNELVPRRVVSASVTESDAGKQEYTLEFDTIFQSNEEKLNRVANKQSGGGLGSNYNNSGGTPLYGAPVIVTPGTPGVKTPKAPLSLLVTSSGYWSTTGVTPQSELVVSWNPVTEFTDETPMTPAGYELWGHQTDAEFDDGYQFLTYVTTAEVTLRTFTPGNEWEFKVRAVSEANRTGSFSTSQTHTPAGPTDPMDAPTTPTLISSKGILVIGWDGLLGGQPTPPQFRYVFAEIAEAEAGPYNRTGPTLSRDARNITIAGLTVGEEYWVRLVAVDGAGIDSARSDSESIVLTGIELGDLDTSIQDAIDAAYEAAIDARSSINLLEDNSFELGTDEFWDILSPSTYYGTVSPRTGVRHLIAESTGTEYDSVLYVRSIPCDPGDTFHFRVYARPEVELVDPTEDDGIELYIMYGSTESSTPTEEIIGDSVSLDTDDYVPVTGQWTAPSDAYFFRPGIRVTETTSGRTYYIDDARLFRMVGQTLIIDGSIVAEKLAAESVVASKIAAEAVAAVHIQAGAIEAEKIAAEAVRAIHIAAESIEADKIAVGAVRTSHISPEVGNELDISANTTVTIIAGRIDGVQDDVDSTDANLQEMQTYYTFGVDGAVVSSPTSPFAVAIRNDSIAMLENGNVVSYWNSGQMYVTQFVGERVVLGNHQLERYSSDSTVVRAL